MAEWKEKLIRTDIDKLLTYLQEEESIPLREASSALGVEKETVLDWARSLEDAGLITISYSATKGKMLNLGKDGEAVEEQVKEAKKEAVENVRKAREWNKERARIRRFEDTLDRLEETLERDEKSVEKLRKHLDDMEEDASPLTEYSDDVETAEEEIEQLKEHLDGLKDDIEVIETLQKHAPEEEGGLLSRIKKALPFGGGEETFKCEDCEKEFDTMRGLKTHHGMVHGGEEETSDGEENDE